jgi:hypothetical protein
VVLVAAGGVLVVVVAAMVVVGTVDGTVDGAVDGGSVVVVLSVWATAVSEPDATTTTAVASSVHARAHDRMP